MVVSPCPTNQKNRMYRMNRLQQNIGYEFKNKQLLELALTHPSTRVNNNRLEDNQRLEFLGDAVLQLAISQYLYEKYPEYDEGKLTSIRTKMVCRSALVAMAKALQIGDCLILAQGLEKMGGRTNPHNLEDAIEAVLGAVYLDGGLESAVQVLRNINHKYPYLEKIGMQNSKGALQEYLQSRKMELPEYIVLEQSGPAHDAKFTVALYIEGDQICSAQDKSIKAAEQKAAQIALECLQDKGV